VDSGLKLGFDLRLDFIEFSGFVLKFSSFLVEFFSQHPVFFFKLKQPDFRVLGVFDLIVLRVFVGGSLLGIVGAHNGFKLMSELVDLCEVGVGLVFLLE
jgi:hypothetical protein